MTSDFQQTARGPRRRWFRFGSRIGLLAIAILALPLAWHVNKVNRQRAAVARIVRLGGNVVYDYQMKPTLNGLYERDSGEPNAWADWLGVDHFHRLVSVDLAGCRPTEEDLRRIARVPSVQSIDLQNTDVTPALLHCLAKLPDLQGLNVRGTLLDDKCLDDIVCHKRLRLLHLGDARFSSAGLARLEVLPDLVWVDLSGSPLNNQGLLHFDKLRRLECWCSGERRSLPKASTACEPRSPRHS